MARNEWSDFLGDGVALSDLRGLLGEPLYLTDVRAAWDCLAFEPSFIAIHSAIVDAPSHLGEFVTSILGAASAIHLVARCQAKRIATDRWVIEAPCIRHLVLAAAGAD